MSEEYREFDLKIVEQIAKVGSKVDEVLRKIDSFDGRIEHLDRRITRLEHASVKICTIAGTVAACISGFFPLVLSWLKETLHI